MKRATVTEAKNGLSALLDRVRAGETVLIVDRGRPVARLVPAVATGEDAPDRLARLERAGLVVRGRGKPPASLWKTKPPRPRKGASALRALIEERRESR